MAVFLSPVGGVAAQFFTNTGAVLTGGKLYTYAAGTTTPAVAYTNSGGAIPQPNPIVLDAAGRVPNSGEIWLGDGVSYKFVLKDANDVLIATYDNIIGINASFSNFLANQEIQTATAGQTVFTLANSYTPNANTLSVFVDGVNQYGPGAQYAYLETNSNTVTFVSGLHVGASVKFTTVQSLTSTQATTAALVSYNQGGTGAVTYTVQDKLRQTVSVKDFGATGDGVTDDTLAIQAAIDAVKAAKGGTVLVPAGSYVCSDTIVLKQGVNLVGQGRAHQPFYAAGDKRGSVLLITVGAGEDAFVFEKNTKGHFGVYNLSIFEAGSAAFNSIINISGVLHPVLEDVEIGCLNTRRGLGLLVQDDAGAALTLYGSFRNLVAHNIIDGIKILNDCNANSFVGGSINCSRWALVMDGTYSFPVATAFIGMSFEGAYVAADKDVDYFASPIGIQGWDIYKTAGYRFNFVDIKKSSGTIFNGCYFELGGYPNPYNDGTHGSLDSVATVCVEPATPGNTTSTAFDNCRFSGCFLFDSGVNTKANNLAGVLNYTAEKPSSLVLRRASAQIIPATTWTRIGYSSTSLISDDSIKFNTDTTVTFTQGGTYMFIANVGVDATTATSDYIQLRAEIAGYQFYGPNFPKTSASNIETGTTVSGLINVVAGNTLEIKMFNSSSSGSLTTLANRNELFIVKVAP